MYKTKGHSQTAQIRFSAQEFDFNNHCETTSYNIHGSNSQHIAYKAYIVPIAPRRLTIYQCTAITFRLTNSTGANRF